MKRSVGLLAGLLALLAGCGGAGSATSAGAVTDGPDIATLRSQLSLEACPTGLSPALPDLRLPCLGGGPDVAVASSGPGRPTVVNLWATWCGPCQAETPLLVALHRRAGDRLGLVGVATESDPRMALLFDRDFGVRYPSVVDDDRRLLSRYGSGLPVTLFVDASGKVVGRQVGQIKTAAQLDGLVRRYLGVRV